VGHLLLIDNTERITAMGYKLSRTVYKVRFEGTEYDGLEMSMGTLSVKEILEVEELMSGDDSKPTFVALVARLARAIQDWNLEDEDGNPIPVTEDALMGFEVKLINTVVSAWVNAIVGVPAPLENDSTSGGKSLEESIGMAQS